MLQLLLLLSSSFALSRVYVIDRSFEENRLNDCIDRLPLVCLPIQTHMGKATFQVAMKWMHDNTSSKAKQSKEGHHSPFAAGNRSLACLPDSLVRSFFRGSLCPVVPADQLRNKEKRQSLTISPSTEPTIPLFRGRARTQAPTTRNYTLELPTFGVIARVNPIEVQ